MGQLYGLRRHTKAAVDGQPPGVLRSANLLFLEKLEVEIAQREVVLRAHLGTYLSLLQTLFSTSP